MKKSQEIRRDLNNMTDQNSFMHITRPHVNAPVASASGPCNIKIQTSACFQILEILSKQVITSKGRIIGSLLGTRSDDGLDFEIKDAFIVPVTETGESIAIDDHAHKKLYQLYKKAHPKDYVLGWFDCSNSIDATTGLIHDFYSKGTDSAYPFPAIYLNVQYLTDDKQIISPKILTYIGAALGRSAAANKATWGNQGSNSYIFTPVPNTVVNNTVTEKLAYNLFSQKQQTGEDLVIGSSSKQASYLSSQIKSLSNTIEGLLSYTEFPTDSDQYIDLLRNLSNSLFTRCNYFKDLNEITESFHIYNQDIIMIEYLTRAVREQIELSAKLTANSETDK